ncbi:MAG: hypothetical protein DHS20C16_17940 [Phycisphaerae bacterium]|nr:MAG: hypothetical protein DHS20C16_17940 [Phycisphaerae bacterium]
MAGSRQIEQPSVAELIEIHQRAYRLLMWINDEAAQNPAWLRPEAVGQMSSRSACEKWLWQNSSYLPSRFLPDRAHTKAFAAMFASFFDTSFRLDSLEFAGDLVDARLRRRRNRIHGGNHNMKHVVASAIRYVLSREGVRLTPDEAGRLAVRESLKIETRIVAYVWELGRRARGKSKGQIVHRLWRSIPPGVRRRLDEDFYWLAKSLVVEAGEGLRRG